MTLDVNQELALNVAKLATYYPMLTRGDKIKTLVMIERWIARERRGLRAKRPRVDR